MNARAFATVALAVSLFGCQSDREFSCQVGAAGVCIRDGVSGQCVPPGFCAFQDSACQGTGLRYDSTASEGLAGTCVNNAGNDGGVENMCGGTELLPGRPGDACGVCQSGVFACVSENELSCNGEASVAVNATGDGNVMASTEFNGSFRAGLSVDNDLTTSWFSAGTDGEADNISRYTWSTDSSECISRVTVVGNEMHPDFPENFGFAQVIVEVYDGSVDAANLTFSEPVNLPGTPDPDIEVTPNARGNIVRLVFSGHENPTCGGFAELIVNALR